MQKFNLKKAESRASRVLIVCVACLPLVVACLPAAGASPTEQLGTVWAKSGEPLEAAGQATRSGLEEIWQRIDERRLKNRTGDQLVAWVIMGLLVGGVIHRFSKLSWLATIMLGLVGAFLGGIVENLIQFKIGMGPVLISYEELLASLIGAVLIVLIARWLTTRQAAKK